MAVDKNSFGNILFKCARRKQDLKTWGSTVGGWHCFRRGAYSPLAPRLARAPPIFAGAPRPSVCQTGWRRMQSSSFPGQWSRPRPQASFLEPEKLAHLSALAEVLQRLSVVFGDVSMIYYAWWSTDEVMFVLLDAILCFKWRTIILKCQARLLMASLDPYYNIYQLIDQNI